ncbi:MAG TPA: FAD:protein FMN transferase [Streptosporangiaceae bacterium]|nr:FAD:protein FMN transferase [Streptosporangiaceae bacterium]
MTATDFTLVTTEPAWCRVDVGSRQVAAADRDALGTTARVVIWPPRQLARVLSVVNTELTQLDLRASRFRPDSEISALHAAGEGSYLISDGLAEAIGVALAAARWTGGLTDPTVGAALISLGYDRDFAAIRPDLTARPAGLAPVPGWRSVRLAGNLLTLPAGVRIDLGATAKGLGADRAARTAYARAGTGGVLVSLGGDLAVAGQPPAGGWPALVADEHRQTRDVRDLSRPGPRTAPRGRRTADGIAAPPAQADPATAQQVRLIHGGLATSSVTCRQWVHGGRPVHHLVDPRTGQPAAGPWRTVSVAAASCAEANAAATAAVIAGHDAVGWLTAQGLPARLVGHDGSIARTAGWPDADGGRLEPPTAARLEPPAKPETPTAAGPARAETGGRR